MKVLLILIVSIIVLMSEVLIKSEGFGPLAGILLLLICIVGSIATKKFRKYAVALLLGLLLSGPFIFLRNRVLGTIYSNQFTNLKEYKSFEVLGTGWFFEYSWTHRYGYTYYALIETKDTLISLQKEVETLYPKDNFRSADYISLFDKQPERYKFKRLVSPEKLQKSDNYSFQKILENTDNDENIKKTDLIILFTDQGYYDLD